MGLLKPIPSLDDVQLMFHVFRGLCFYFQLDNHQTKFRTAPSSSLDLGNMSKARPLLVWGERVLLYNKLGGIQTLRGTGHSRVVHWGGLLGEFIWCDTVNQFLNPGPVSELHFVQALDSIQCILRIATMPHFYQNKHTGKHWAYTRF